MERFIGLIGMVLILGIAFLLSNNRKAINYRTVGVGLLLQLGLAVFILKTSVGKNTFAWLGAKIQRLLEMADQGALFVFGPLVNKGLLDKVLGPENSFIFFFSLYSKLIYNLLSI